jgi:hypothetical protein
MQMPFLRNPEGGRWFFFPACRLPGYRLANGSMGKKIPNKASVGFLAPRVPLSFGIPVMEPLFQYKHYEDNHFRMGYDLIAFV